MKKIYLACPYTSIDQHEIEKRVAASYDAAAAIMAKGYCVFNPIGHSHPIAVVMPQVDNCDHDFWLKQDLPFLTDWADEMWILCLDGWHLSLGIQLETRTAIRHRIKVKRIDPNQLRLESKLTEADYDKKAISACEKCGEKGECCDGLCEA